MGDYIRSYSESQFNKHHSTPKVREGERSEGGRERERSEGGRGKGERGRRKAEERETLFFFIHYFLG